ncbi:MAG: hypothetical protein JXQ66_07610 [Campylobacterales bacterium]|nr:hypothetical protein [Campylobacterales bacterium]
MIREVIRPQQTSITIDIPQSYINKDVEFIMFALDEKDEILDIKQDDLASLGGALNRYANPSKIELESSAWEEHILDKYR